VPRKPLVANQDVALVGGVVLTVGAMILFYDAYEGRDAKRPWWLRLVPTA